MDELSQLLEALVQSPAAAAQRGFQVVRLAYDSPIPDYDKLELYRRPYSDIPSGHIAWRYEDQLALWSKLKTYASEFDFPENPVSDDRVYHRRNDYFCDVDGFTLYSLLRELNPKRVIEVGSGFSTKLMSAAMVRNARPGSSVTCIEPFRADVIKSLQVDAYVAPLQEVDLGLFDTLSYGDVLFIDSSHVVKPYGDVNLIFSHVLPRIPTGVWVHFHDIFLPFDYPESWMVKQRHVYSEQYMLSAFLAHNSEWEVKFAVNYFAHRYGVNAIQRELGLLHESGGSFWIRRR